MQKYTDRAKRELISSRDNHIDCASMFCFVKVSGLLCFFNAVWLWWGKLQATSKTTV